MGNHFSKDPLKDQKQGLTSSGRDASYVNADEEVIEEVPTRHAGPIHSLCIVDESHLLSGGADKDILLYSWINHINKVRFRGPTRDVMKVDYNPTSSLVHAASRDRTIYEWKWPPDNEDTAPSTAGTIQEPHQKLEGHTLGVTALASTTDDGHLLCSGSRDNSVCLWDVNTGKTISSMTIPRNLVTGLEWIHSQNSVLQSSEDKTLRVWDFRSCSVVQHYRPKQHVQMCCAVSEDSKYFLSGSSGTGKLGGEVTLWDRRKEKFPLREYKGHMENVHDCIFLTVRAGPQVHNLIASTGSDSTVKIWDRETGDSLHSEYLDGAGPVTSVVSPHQGLVGCSSFRGGVSIWTVMALDSNIWNLNIRAKY